MSRHALASLWLLFASACSRGDAGLPDPYAGLEVPDDLRSPERRAQGAALFQDHCALCHGARADGHGARREGLQPKPRDFTDPAWRERASPRAVFYAVREGVRGTAMPAWKSLDDDEVWDLVAFLLSAGEASPPR
ncbi:MAG TPA: cytochrome c [Vicinamibacteria bacterium]|nr:cytochrome c [Vicinamibacteria bacterium]